jgi:hypothetical protein
MTEPTNHTAQDGDASTNEAVATTTSTPDLDGVKGAHSTQVKP